MHELITLQMGQLSNFLATHFWNTQESYFTYSDQDESPIDHDIHWRPGVALDGSDTFLPRTVLYDLKGCFGSLRKMNAMYGQSQEHVPAHEWDGSPQLHKQPQIQPSAYQQSLDLGTTPPKLKPSDVRYWSDFSRVIYHPKSLNQLYDYELNSSIGPFDKSALGKELFNALDKEHDIIDRDFRSFVEEADQMQGLQVVTTIDDAWAGFATEYVERLRDEYGKVAIWVWGLQTPVPAARIEQRRLQMANTAGTVKHLCEHASILVPMAIPQSRPHSNISVDPRSAWHATALLSTAVETAALPSRLKSTSAAGRLQATLSDLVNGLDLNGRQTINRLQMSILGPLTQSHLVARAQILPSANDEKKDTTLDTDFFDILRANPPAAKRIVNGGGGVRTHLFCQTITTRGTPPGQDDQDPGRQRLRAANLRTGPARYDTDRGFPMLDSFPQIYLDGNDMTSVESFGVKTSLSTDTSVSEALKQLRTAVLPSIDVDDREDIGNGLADLAEAYIEGWSCGSDEDDD